MTIAQRVLLADFALANPLYANARVWVYEAVVETGLASTSLATLYRAPNGTDEEANPITLDSQGKLQRAGQSDGASVRVLLEDGSVYPLAGRLLFSDLSVDPASGRLTLSQVVASGGRTPRFFTLGPDGRWLYALNEDSDTIARFAVDPATGRLAPTGEPVACGSPVCMVFSRPFRCAVMPLALRSGT